MDVISVVLSTVGFGVAGEAGWTSVSGIGSITIGLIALMIFAVRQTKWSILC